MNNRQVPPAFYGIYNNDHRPANLHDKEALDRANIFLMNSIFTEYRLTMAEIDENAASAIIAAKKEDAYGS